MRLPIHALMLLALVPTPFDDRESRLARGRNIDVDIVPTDLQEAFRLVRESWARGFNPTVSLIGLDAAKRLAALGMLEFVDTPMPLEVA